MKIAGAESFLLDVPIGKNIADSMQSVTHLEFVGLTIDLEDGTKGTGYTVTVGHGGGVIRNSIDALYLDDLIGQDPFDVREIWQQLYYGKSHWIGRAGATTMAQSAVDIALWDLVAKVSGKPLWKVLGGGRSNDIPIYNTHGGWLNYSTEQLVGEALEFVQQGYKALKMKVGLEDSNEDFRRVEAVRTAIDDDIILMVDANQKWDLYQASLATRLLEGLDLGWVEEPLHPDDVRSHSILKERTSLPIALGEHIYTVQAFRDYMELSAVDVIQVDVCRIGGITPWLEVAAMANSFNLRVCPHAGDLMQVHQHLVKAIPNSWLLEVIPLWEEGPFAHQIQLENGICKSPTEPGASTDFTRQAIDEFRVR